MLFMELLAVVALRRTPINRFQTTFHDDALILYRDSEENVYAANHLYIPPAKVVLQVEYTEGSLDFQTSFQSKKIKP
jgi:hypothetical protein